MLDSVYTDQIWEHIHSDDFRFSTITRLKSLTNSIPSCLVEIIDGIETRKLTIYKTIVSDNVLTIDYIRISPEFWGGFSYQSKYINRLPTKLFNCFIHRACSRRQIWFYEFVRRNLLDQGAVSFLLDHRIHKCSSIKEKQELFERLYTEECGTDFLIEHEKIKDYVPYRNFDGDLDQIIVDTKISIVIETYFIDYAISFSEKIFRALQLPRPILMYNVPGAVSVLRETGFDLYDDIVDHSYDNIADAEERMVTILGILEDFKNFNYTEDTLIDFERRAQKNRDLLASLKENWPEKLNKVEEQIKAIRNNANIKF